MGYGYGVGIAAGIEFVAGAFKVTTDNVFREPQDSRIKFPEEDSFEKVVRAPIFRIR
jgi:hypothetical protein